jgi:predicted aspartyl protease
LSTAFAERAGLVLRDGGTVEGSAGNVEARATDVTIEVIGLPPRNAARPVYPFASYDPLCVGHPRLGLPARCAIRAALLDRQLIWNAPKPEQTVALKIDDVGIPRVAVRIDGRELDLRIDTGASFPPGRDAYVNVTVDQAERPRLTGQPEACSARQALAARRSS